MFLSSILAKFDGKRISVREFGRGARNAAKSNGVTVVIDVFRASTTILTLLELDCEVYPFLDADEALASDTDYKVGETGSHPDSRFDFDNSPIMILQNAETLQGKRVAVRTTNGTRGLVSAIGSHEIIVGAFRNLTAVVKHCLKRYNEGFSISFVAMGSKKVSRPEDVHCAKMMHYRLISEIGAHDYLLENSEDNPWNRSWIAEIADKRFKADHKRRDYRYSLNLDMCDFVPIFRPELGKIEVLHIY